MILDCESKAKIQSNLANNLNQLKVEMQVMSRIRHKNLIHMHDAMQDSVSYYLVMDFCPGGDLLDHQLKQPERRFSEATAVFYLSCLRDAFLCLKIHDIMHRDIKLENLFLDATGHLKVGDFGFAKQGHESFTKLGSHNTMAPEIFFHMDNRSKKYDDKCDLWSIGVVFHIMLFGKKPYFCNVRRDDKLDFTQMKRNLRKFNAQKEAFSDISPDSADLIRRLLTKNPRLRISETHQASRASSGIGSSTASAAQRTRRASSCFGARPPARGTGSLPATT